MTPTQQAGIGAGAGAAAGAQTGTYLLPGIGTVAGAGIGAAVGGATGLVRGLRQGKGSDSAAPYLALLQQIKMQQLMQVLAVQQAEQRRIDRLNAQRGQVEQLYADPTDINANDAAIAATLQANQEQAKLDQQAGKNQLDYAAQARGQGGSTVDATRRAGAATAYDRMFANWQAAAEAGRNNYRTSRGNRKAALMSQVNSQSGNLTDDALGGYMSALQGNLGDQQATLDAQAGIGGASDAYRSAISQMIGGLAQGGASIVSGMNNRPVMGPQTRSYNGGIQARTYDEGAQAYRPWTNTVDQ